MQVVKNCKSNCHKLEPPAQNRLQFPVVNWIYTKLKKAKKTHREQKRETIPIIMLIKQQKLEQVFVAFI